MKIDFSHPGTAAVLSFILPGTGQMFSGHFFWGIFWFIVTPGLWIGSTGTLGWILHFIAAWQAYRQAQRKLIEDGNTDLALRSG